MITRFAPSPTGPLHLGHAYSALLAYDRVKTAGGLFHLRIEDTDQPRCKPHWEAQIFDDLAWLGLSWEEPVLRQSERSTFYRSALDMLGEMGLIYPCSCTRGDIRQALSAPQEGVAQPGIYPGTCRGRSMSSRQPTDAIRLDMARAIVGLNALTFNDIGPEHPGTHRVKPEYLTLKTGDIILERKDINAASYILSAILDDDFQNISEIIRGADLFEITFVQVLLQHLLGLKRPTYFHHRLIRDENGKRLAKRDDARALSLYRNQGCSPDDIREMVGLQPAS
ncbi:MAG: tRNA glutamyl-Q(34) synthetase GluQRS [Rhodobacteraceae bacterium]|nr:tRNA glutamyl-Q(34) synthetase GluQRS [Paracoccaceae bacterium]